MRRLPAMFAAATVLLTFAVSAQTPAVETPAATAPAPAADAPTVPPTPVPTPAQPAVPPSPSAPQVVAVYGFASNPAAQSQAPAVEALVASGLTEAKGFKVMTQADVATLISTERQKALLGAGSQTDCSETCMTELAGAIGARYVISGRVDRFGDAYVLSANLFDSHEARVLTKAHADASDDAALPGAASALSRQLLSGLGVETPVAAPSAEAKAHRFSLGLHIGNAFLQNIAALNLSGDLEFGWQFRPSWVAFIQVGVTLVRADNALLADQFGLVPSVIGIRSLYRIDSSFQPYWGFGLGVQLTLGDFGVLNQTGPLPTLMGFLGFQYLFTDRFSLGLEGSTNVAQWVLGVNKAQGGRGFNLDLNGTVAWRF